jgi:hypothetical protein
MLIKKVTFKRENTSVCFGKNIPIEKTIYYFLGIPFRKDIIRYFDKKDGNYI